MQDNSQMTEQHSIRVQNEQGDKVMWRAKWKVEKRMGNWTGEQVIKGLAPLPYEVLQQEGNLLMYGGASCLWECLIGNGTAGAGNLQFFANGNAAIGVGDSADPEAATQTDLQAATNKLRLGMDGTYPQHSDATTSGAASIKFQSTFGSAQANFTWAEFGVFNATVGQRMLNRKVSAMGVKSSGATWTLLLTLTLA